MTFAKTVKENTFQIIRSALEPLLQKSFTLTECLRLTESVGELLQTLPLPSDEYCVATNRVSNARRYFESAEAGAAKWELRMLRNQLLAHANRPVYEGIRKFRAERNMRVNAIFKATEYVGNE